MTDASPTSRNLEISQLPACNLPITPKLYRNFPELVESLTALSTNPEAVWEHPRGQKDAQDLHLNPPPASFYMTAALFGASGIKENPYPRRKDNVVGMSIVMFDLDNSTNAAQLIGLIENPTSPLYRYNFIAYHTFSSTLSEPRMRLIVELDPSSASSVTHDHYKQVLRDLADELSFLVANKSDDLTMMDSTHPQGSPMYPNDYGDAPKLAGTHINGRPYIPAPFDPFKYGRQPAAGATPSPDFEENPLLKVQIIEAALAIPPEDLADRNSWFNVGASIHHAFNGEPEGLALWLKISERAPGWDDDTPALSERYYEEFDSDRTNGITYKTILWFNATTPKMGGDFMDSIMDVIKKAKSPQALMDEEGELRSVTRSIMDKKTLELIGNAAHKKAMKLDKEFLLSASDMKNIMKEHLNAGSEEKKARTESAVHIIIEKLPFYNDSVYVAERNVFFPVSVNSTRDISEDITLYTPEQMVSKHSHYFLQHPLDKMFNSEIDSDKAGHTILNEGLIKSFLTQHSQKVDQITFDPTREPFFSAKFKYADGKEQEQKAVNAYRKTNVAQPANPDKLNVQERREAEKLQKYIEWVYTRTDGSLDDLAILSYFMYHVTRKPEGKILWTLVVCSRAAGIGKSMLGGMMSSILSDRYSTEMQGLGQMLGEHNIYLENKLLINLDDVSMSIQKDSERSKYNTKIKPLITLKTMLINPKGTNQYSAPNFTNLYMTSNQEVCVPIDVQDRRHAVVSPTVTKEQAFAYADKWMEENPQRFVPNSKTDPEKRYEAFYDDIEHLIRSRPDIAALVIDRLYTTYAHLGANGSPLSHRHAPDTPAKDYIISQTLDDAEEGADILRKLHEIGELPDFFTHHEVTEACKRSDFQMPATFDSNKGRGQIFRVATNIAKVHQRFAYRPPAASYQDPVAQMTYFASPSVTAEEIMNIRKAPNKEVQAMLDLSIENFWEGKSQQPRATALPPKAVPTTETSNEYKSKFITKGDE